MQAFKTNGKRHLPVKHVLLRFFTTPFVFLVGRLYQNIVRLKSLSAFHFSFLHVLKRFAGLKFYALLLLFGGVFSFNAEAQTTVTLGTGTLTASGISPLFTDGSDFAITSSRVQYFYTAADLTAGGWTAGAGYSITQLGWRIANNNSGAAFANYTIRMANANPTTYPDNTSAPDFPVASLTTVKNAFTFTPANTNGYQMITLDAPFTWDGTSNLVVDVCFSESTNGPNQPLVYRFNGIYPNNVVRYNVGGPGSLCSTATLHNDAPYKAQAQLVFTAASTCTAPTSQATIGSYTNNVSPGTSLTVGWSRGTPSPGNEVIVVGRLTATADVAPTSGSTYTANAAFGTVGTTTGTGNFVVYKGTGTSVNVTALTAGTPYTFTVYEYNSTGTCYKTPGSSSAVTTWAPPTYCTPLYANGACFGNWDIINNVSIGAGGTVLNQSATGCSGAVADYTGTILNMTQGVTYPFSITTITDISSPHFAVWIDFNDNGVFSSGEWLVDVQSNGSGVFSGNFTIPAGAATGNHRMRIRAAATTFVNGSTSCEEGSYGEAHDYTATIVVAPSIAIANNSQVTAGTPLQGATNVLLHKSQLTITNANATITGMGCTTAGTYASASITNLKVWYMTAATFNSGTATLLSTLTTPGTAGAKTFSTFTSQAINSGTTGYIYITADIAAGATVGNTINLSALTTADFTFSSGTKSGTTTAGGVQTITAPPPAFTITPTTLTALNYTQCSGPSTAQSFTVSGSNLTAGTGNIAVTGPTNYEVSTTSSTTGFASSVTLPYSGGVITSQPKTVWVRLKAGLFSGNYNSESITISGGGVSSSGSVTCSGTVSASGGTTTYTIGTQSATTSNYPIDRTNTGTRCSQTSMSYNGDAMRAVDSPNLPASTTYTGIAWKPSATFTGTLTGTLNIWMRVDASRTSTWSTTGATQVYTGNLTGLTYTAGTWRTFNFTSNFTADLSTAGALTILVQYTSTAGDDPTWDAASFATSAYSFGLGGTTCGGGSSGSGTATLPIFQLIAGSAPATPTLTRSTASLTGFTYAQGAGPSTSQSFNISGANLVCSPGNLTVTGSTNYEVSNNNSTFGASTTIAYSSATLAATPVYVRLKAGLPQASYNSETITISGSGATAVTVTCSGSVSAAAATPSIAIADNGMQVALANQQQGTTNVLLHKSSLAVTIANATLTGMGCTTAGTYASASITNLKVWYMTAATFNSGTATLLSTLTTPGTAGAKTFSSFTSQAINSGNTGYIYITADIAAGATVTNTINLSALTTANFTFSSGTLSGTTTAGGVQTITAACVAPATPATPTGSQTGVCSGSQYTYNVTAVAGATSYDWTLPSGWTATSLNTATNSITATAGSSGNISVRVNTCGGSSSYSGNLAITVTTSPTISFPSGQTVSMGCSIPITLNPSGASTSASGGVSVSTSGGVNSLVATFEMASSVQITSGACSSPVYTITVTPGVSNRGTLASGDQTICDGQTPNSIAYSSAATGTGITYQWYYKTSSVTCPTTNEATTAWTSISGAQSNSYSPAQGFVPSGSTYTFACYVGSSSGTGSCGGWSSGCRKITVNSIPSAPTGSASQSFCSAASPTVAALSATGTAIQWYDAATNGSLLASSAALTNGTSYYASQTVSGCESTNRLAVAVTVTTTPSAPTGSASQSFCSAANPTVASLSATGTTILWYAASSGGSSLATSTALTNSTSYYASQTVSGCESTNRLAVAAVLNANGTWIGGTSSDWNTTANWCGGVPASGANILFSPSAVNNLVLDQNRTVGNVDFNGTSRSIHLGAYDLTTSGIISNYSASSYVKSAGTGKLIATLVDGATFTFPIGNTSYNPLSIKNTTGASDAFSVGLKDAVYLNGSSGTTISTPHVSRTWDISKTNANAGTGVDLIFNWNTGDVSGTLVDPRMNHHTGNGWEIPTTITSSTAGTNTLTVVGYTGTFSPFAIGEGSSPLPVELVSFQANCIDQGVALTWQTASEHSSAYFEVDRSEDSQNWSLLEQVAAAGNSTSLLSYSILDSEKVRNTVYYRLNQVDFDGANKRYNPIYMNCGNIGNVITTYPNPSTDNGFQLLFENSLGERIIGLNILDALGNLVYTKELQLQNGTNTFNVYDFKVETGVYFLQIKEADGVTSLIKHVHFSK